MANGIIAYVQCLLMVKTCTCYNLIGGGPETSQLLGIALWRINLLY